MLGGDDEWVSSRAAAKLLGVHASAVPKMVRRGELTPRKGKRPSLNRVAVMRLAQARAEKRAEVARLRDLPPPPKRPAPEPEPPDDVHPWVRADVVAACLGVQPAAVRQRAMRGRLPHAVGSDGTRWFQLDQVFMTLHATAVAKSQRRRRVAAR